MTKGTKGRGSVAPPAKPSPIAVKVSIQAPRQKAPPPHDPHGPFMPHPLDGAGFFARLEKAETIEEWNEEMAALVRFLVHCATPQGANHASIVVWSENIRAAIALGFKPPSRRPKHRLQAEEDAFFLRWCFGANNHNVTLQDAVEELRIREKIPIGRDIRARVRRAEAQLGYKLKRGKRAE